MFRILVCSASGHEGRMHSEPPQIGLHFPSENRFRAISSFTLPAFQSLLLYLAQRWAGGKTARGKLSMVARPHGISTSSSSSCLLGIDEGAPASQAITTKRRRKALLISPSCTSSRFWILLELGPPQSQMRRPSDSEAGPSSMIGARPVSALLQGFVGREGGGSRRIQSICDRPVLPDHPYCKTPAFSAVRFRFYKGIDVARRGESTREKNGARFRSSLLIVDGARGKSPKDRPARLTPEPRRQPRSFRIFLDYRISDPSF